MTRAQKRALDFIRAEIETKGIPPSYEEIMWDMGLKSKSGAHRIVKRLAEAGYIIVDKARARSIRLPADDATLSVRPEWETIRDLLREPQPTLDAIYALRTAFHTLDRARGA